MSIPYIENGKLPLEPIDAMHGFFLPPTTPFGNLSLKIFRIIQRLDHVNLRIRDLNDWFTRRNVLLIGDELNSLTNEVTDDHCLGDEITFWIRRTIDELVSLMYLKIFWIKNEKTFPNKIKIDCIGRLLEGTEEFSEDIKSRVLGHVDFLKNINNVANAHKHSFINTDMLVTSGKEPQIFALNLFRNDLKNNKDFYFIPVRELIRDFNLFYKDAIKELREWSVISLQ